MQRAREGDLDAFDEVVLLHAPAAYRAAVAVVGESLARGLVGEAFLVAWQQLPHLRDPEGFVPWLHRIIVNKGRSMLRRGRAVREIPVPAWHEGTLVTPHDGMGAGEARAVLASAFAALPYDQRAVIALHYAVGLSLHEVAEALDVPVGTAKSRLAAALGALRARSGIDVTRGAASRWARPHADARADADAGADAVAEAGGAAMTDERMPPQEPHVEAFLESLAVLAVPGELAAAVSSHLRERPSRRASLRLPVLAAAAGLLLTVAVAMAAGWAPPFDVLPGPQVTVSLPLPSLSGIAPEASPAPAGAWEWATIVGQGAEIVADPAVTDVIDLTPDATRSNLVLVLERRVVNGRTWVRVEQGGHGWDARFVWIPETIPSVAPAGYDVFVLERTRHLPCYTGEPPTIESLASMTAALRLACYGAASFTIGPVQVVRAWDRPRNAGAPAWLAGEMTTMLEGPRRSDGLVMTVPVHVDPGLGINLPANAWVRVTLHLDDPAAATCTRQTTAADRPVGEPSDHVLWCRQQLVVTGYDEVPAPTPAPPSPSMPSASSDPTPDATRTSLPKAPIAGREGQSAVWTGSHLVVWGGRVVGEAVPPPDGAALDVLAGGEWTIMPASPLTPRRDALIAWTGSEVLIFGGHAVPSDLELADGAAWSPATGSWRTLPKAPLAADFQQAAVWTGDRWLVMSGATLAAYDPVTDAWATLASPPIDPSEDKISLGWTGSDLLLVTHAWEGIHVRTLRPGGSWTERALPPNCWIPAGSPVTTGDTVTVPGYRWEDCQTEYVFGSVGIWHPSDGTWSLEDTPLPDGEPGILAWSGQRLFAIGLEGVAARDGPSDTWTLLRGFGEDRLRDDPAAVWAGDRLIVWGGAHPGHGDPQPDGSQYTWPGGT
ncbi:MAG TPA: RNA polymerase sigma factor [Candidatus Limnocylindrales bacterium]|nr:RNA polymerase sigma factor [Candidatus Limnocylindrales bacterium]